MQPEKRVNLLRLIILLTFLFIAGQVVFLVLAESFSSLFDVTLYSVTTSLFFSTSVLTAFGQYLLAQLLVYGLYVFFLWYVVSVIRDRLSLGNITSSALCLLLWMTSIVSLYAWNCLYVPHSVFTKLILHNLFNDALSHAALQLVFYISLGFNLFALCVAIVLVIAECFSSRRLLKHAVFFILALGIVVFGQVMAEPHEYKPLSAASAEKPNIIIISFDAVRPDFLSFFNKDGVDTPNFDKFLKYSAIFSRNYTPVARTMPSWAGILTAQYPVHNRVRENNTLLDLVKVRDSLPRILQQAGYTTVYATDDRRYNSIDARYGFDHVIGPKGTVPDYMLGTLNDFPLSNLISPTIFGKFLFPYNHANHGADYIYKPDNFLSEINTTLQQTRDAPLFLAMHFDLSGWPFYWFNDHASYNEDVLDAYKNSLAGNDRILAKVLKMLQKNQLLEHAYVFLVSDHGITHGLPQDRIVQESMYEGNPELMKVMRYKYADAKKFAVPADDLTVHDKDLYSVSLNAGSVSPFDLGSMGIDTSFGYGGDLLSLKQNLSLFAVKAYGTDAVVPHFVEGRSMLLDLGPTILDVLQLSPIQEADGISLKPYLSDPDKQIPDRPIYLESAYSIGAMEQKDIIMTKVLSQSLKYFYVNPRSGTVAIYPPLMKVLLANKQRAVLQGDWLLAFYPQSERFKYVQYKENDPNATTINHIVIQSHDKNGKKITFGVQKRILDPYFVLVNVKTGKWTTSEDNPLAVNSPMAEMKHKLQEFYGDEMSTYGSLGLDG